MNQTPIDTAASECALAYQAAVHALNLQLQQAYPTREELTEWRAHLNRALTLVNEIEKATVSKEPGQ